MYRSTVAGEVCPVCFMIASTLSPFSAALVQKPDLSECDPNSFELGKARPTAPQSTRAGSGLHAATRSTRDASARSRRS